MDFTILAGAALIAAFHCEADEPVSLTGPDSAPALFKVGLPPEAAKRSFDVRIAQTDKLPSVEVIWPDDYMRLAQHVTPAFETADGSYAFTGFSVGPCLFTDKACVTQFSIVDRGENNGKADLLIVPSSLASIPKTKTKASMTVLIRGSCQRTDLKK